MKTWRRAVALATAGAVAFAAYTAAPAAAQEPAAPVATTAPPIVDDSSEVIHSWSLAPGGSTDPSEAGGRSELAYTGDPGTVIDDRVDLYNYGNVRLTFRVYASDAFIDEAGRFDLLPGDQEPTDVGSWIDVEQEYVDVDPGTVVTIPITVTIPDSADPGDHVGGIVAASLAVSPTGQRFGVERRTGTRVNLRVNGPLRTELAIEDLSTSYQPAANPADGTAEVRYRVENRGNVRMRGTTSVSVSGPFGIGKESLAAEELPEILPGQSVTITRELDGVPAFGLAFTSVDVEPVAVDEAIPTQPESRGTVSFAPPIAVLLVLLAVVLALLVRRRYRRHQAGPVATEPEREPQLT